MKKHRFRNKLNSILGSHIDPDKDEELKGRNIEMEDNYKQILELLKEEDKDDRNNLVELIEDFHKHHQTIYERYDHITGELRAKVHSKKEKDSSSSSSSDSDSDDLLTKKGSKNGKLNVVDILKEQLQAATTQIDELTGKLATVTEEKEALSSECLATSNKLQETEKKFGELNLEADRLHEENSKLLAKNEDLNLKFEKSKVLEGELKAVVVRLEGENENFKSELSRMKEKLEATEEELSNLSKTLDASDAEKNSLLIKGSELADEIKVYHEKVEELANECGQLKEKLADKEKELLSHTEMHISHKSETEIKIRGFEEEFENLNSQKKVIEIQKEETQSQIENLTERVSNLQKELESLSIRNSKLEEDMKALVDKVNEKQEEIVSLCSQKLELESQLEKSIKEVSGCLIQIDSLKEDLAGKQADEQKLLEEKEVFLVRVRELEEEVKSLHGLKTELETSVSTKTQEIADYVIQIENFKEEVAKMTLDQAQTVEECESKIKDLELKLESANNMKIESETQLEKKGLEISELLVAIQSLREELESKSKEQEKTVEEKEGFESKVKDLELQTVTLNNLKHEAEIHLEKKGAEIAELSVLSQTQKEELETQSKERERIVEEKDGFELMVKDLKLQLESLSNLKNELENQLEKKGVEIAQQLVLSHTLKEELESKSKELEKTTEEKDGYESKVKDLELKVESLNNLKNETEVQLEKKGAEIAELLVFSQTLKEELESKLKEHEETVKEKESYESKVKDLEVQLESLNNLKNESDMQLEKKGADITELLSLNQCLREELESKSRELAEEKKVNESRVKDLELKLESLNNLKNESEVHLEKKGSEIAELMILSQSLKEELESKSKEQEKTVEEKEGFESKVKDLELQTVTLNNLKHEAEIHLEKKGAEIAELSVLSQTQKEELETQSKERERIVEEKDGFELMVKDLKLQLESLSNLKNELENQLEKKGVEIAQQLVLSHTLKEELESKSKELEKTTEEKDGYESKVKDLELKVESLNNLKNETEVQLEKKGAEIAELLVFSQTLKEELESKLKEHEETVKEKESYESKVKDLEVQLESLNNLKNESDMQLEKKGADITELLSLNQCLREELESKSRELAEEKKVNESRVKDLELKLESLNNLKNESEVHLEKKGSEIAELMILSQSLKEELESKSREHTKTAEEKEGYESKVKDLELQVELLNNSKIELELQLEKKGIEISELVILNQSLKEELESKSKDQAKTVEEKESYESKANDLELKLESLNSLKVELEFQLEKKCTEISELLIQSESLKEELESKSKDQAKTVEEKEGYESQVKDLELKLKSLETLKNESEMQLEKKGLELSELTILIETLKEQLESKSQDQTRTVEEKESYAKKINELEKQLNSVNGLKDELEKKFESEKRNDLQLQNQLQDKIQELETTLAEKEQSVEQLEEAIEDLKGDLEIKGDDITTLTETVRNLEVKIRLANQKLRVTEQTLNEKEGEHAGKEEKLHQESKSLVLRISTLSEIIASYKESEENVKKEITQKVKEITGGMDSLTVKFEEDHGHVLTQIYEIMNEIQVSKISIKNMSSEKDDLKEKVAKMVVQLKALEIEKEKLKNSLDQLVHKTTGNDEKIKYLEKQLHLKDEGLLDLGEEKREAIRQLCMLVDYQRDRYDHLQELLSKKTNVGRRQTAR